MPEPVPAPSRARRWTSVLVSLAVTVACFGAILAFLDLEWEGTEAMLRRVTAGYLAVLAAFLLVMHVLRAMRFRVLLAEPVSLRRLMSIDMLCQFYANFLPFRTGEVALPVLLRREGVTVPRTVAMLLVARSFDVLALLVLGSVLHMWGYDWIAPLLQRLRWPLAGATAVGGALGVPLLCGSAGGVRWLADRVAAPERGWIPRQAWLADRLQDLSAGLALVNRRRLWWTAGLTLLIWAVAVAYAVYNCSVLAPMVPWRTVAVIAVLINLLTLLPIHGLAGLGTSEGISVAFFATTPLPQKQLLPYALTSHAVRLVLVVVYGGVGWILFRRRRAGEPDRVGDDAGSGQDS